MAFGFPAYVKERKTLVLSQETTQKIAEEILETLEWQKIGLHPIALDYKTLGSILTYGERVYVNVTECEIIIRSECLLPTRFFDFGKNKANIDAFWTLYNERIKQ